MKAFAEKMLNWSAAGLTKSLAAIAYDKQVREMHELNNEAIASRQLVTEELAVYIESRKIQGITFVEHGVSFDSEFFYWAQRSDRHLHSLLVDFVQLSGILDGLHNLQATSDLEPYLRTYKKAANVRANVLELKTKAGI